MPLYPKRMITHFFDPLGPQPEALSGLALPYNVASRKIAQRGPEGLYCVRTDNRVTVDGTVRHRDPFAQPYATLDKWFGFAVFNKPFLQAYGELAEFEEMSSIQFFAAAYQVSDADPAHIFNIDPMEIMRGATWGSWRVPTFPAR